MELLPAPLQPGGPPIWLGSWGSDAGLRRVARLADGWLASAYNTTPEAFDDARRRLGDHLRASGRDPERFPNALATMWLHVTEDESAAETVLTDVLGPALHRAPDELRERLLVGPAGGCADMLARYEAAGVERVLLWPVGEPIRQLEQFHDTVLPRLATG
jgi:alkanesulfonate monooxygenase SsuD/methylene tetrahydromethanopterin reductase-like flavin-dependent oxidoreductase (luciferase family)